MVIHSELYAIVLAGGDGVRLTPLTTALYGRPLPKQYAILADGKSLLATTLDRLAGLVPPERTVVVATAMHRRHPEVDALARTYPRVEFIFQPRNLDTAVGITWPLARILRRDPDASIAVLPSDHFLRHQRPFISTLTSAAGCSQHHADRLTLLGARATVAETEYGWIVSGEKLQSVPGSLPWHAVRRFVEKPSLEIAAGLMRHGALWNTFVFTGPGALLWELLEEFLPRHASAFARYRDAAGDQSALLDEMFTALPPANFSHDVLEHATANLAVVECEGSGWSDWGTPRRVFDSLEGTPEAVALQIRLRAQAELETNRAHVPAMRGEYPHCWSGGGVFERSSGNDSMIRARR